ncbi:hypothetical protein TD95_003330 [Thielaviopsis punctulata]|uniref:ER membrane protein complex subunit 10 n=1 Tax=Thielaviopsis punctulata TaxID=72032 RepID=A0A0F4ZAC0_9PEZI|nr:hypothetical protein TD95_003330 [Thielaviopsis punctulata]
MKLSSIVAGLMAAAAAHAMHTADIFLQPVPSTSDQAPALLARVHYDISDPSAASASIVAWEAPELGDDAELVRIGVWDAAAAQWQSSTTVAGVENFDKGFSPSVLLSVDQRGNILGATVKGVRVDAGQTRDSAPRAVVLVSHTGKQPELNKPVVLSPTGRKQQEEEKTFLQKYWMFILAGVVLLMSGGSDGK